MGMGIMANIMGAMAATTQTESKGRVGGAGAAVLAIAVGGLLVLAGAARLWTVWQAEPARVGLEAVQRSPEAPRPALLLEIAQSLAEAGRLGPVIVPWATSDQGASLEALMRLSAGDPAALPTLEAALRTAPGDPNGWLWLARLRLKDGNVAAAGQALRVSLLAGQVLPEKMRGRLRLALDLYPALDADTQQLVQRQVRLVWVMYPQDIPALLAVQAYRTVIIEALATATAADEQQFRRVNRLDRPPVPQP